ncbi:MAG: molecular chaperone TorD family protein [Gammaproteobacteria bacterium]|nr:molecular chaperone TorD family protein [Gammaproteobacteria bacterium]
MTSKTDIHQATSALAPEEQARAYVYSLLGALLAAPANEQLLGILERIKSETVSQKSIMAKAWNMIRRAACEDNPDQIADEYHDLFIGLGRGELIPYASWYLTGYLMEKPLAALRGDLEKLGFTSKTERAEPEDHIAALCEVMGMVIAENKLGFEKQKAFFETHMAPWITRFFTDLTQAKSARFYQTVGEFGRCFMEVERQYFSMQV